MILTRLGNKRRIAAKIRPYFPEHTLFVDLFFGAGGIFFNKEKARFSILNDLDGDVYNLFTVVRDSPGELEDFWRKTCLHEMQWNYWKATKEVDPIRKAARFLYLSNFGVMGLSNSMKFEISNTHANVANRIMGVYEILKTGVQFMNCDFRNVLRRIAKDDKSKAFVYADPPYIGTSNNYQSGFTEQDSKDLFKLLVDSGIRFAMSEFDHPLIIEQANHYGLIINTIGERQNLNNRRTEILITNYDPLWLTNSQPG